MERFKEAIYKQREEINERMTKIYSLLKEYTKGKSPEKVLVRDEVGKPVTKYINAISLVRMENNKGKKSDEVVDKNIIDPIELVEKEDAMDDVKDNESDRSVNEDSTRWGKINKKTIEDLVDNHKYNNSLLATRLGKMDNETCNSLPVGPMYEAILKKKLSRKDGRGGNFVIPCSTGRLKFMKALAGQDIKEDEYMPLILRTSFLTTARAEIKFYKGSMTLKAGRYKIRFVRTLEFPSKIEERIERDVDPMIPTNYLNRRILEWEERIKNCQKDEMRFSKWRSKVFDDKNIVGHNFFIYELAEEGSSVSGEGVT
ncbi:hypothetical protein Tco_0988415 [Tanacetum coccineum]|uniref:Uncharacterized protein n=1 Tax=Tanacetum coccineum TaxID=301880 RepID=A0ABQ5EQV1_9ASTR